MKIQDVGAGILTAATVAPILEYGMHGQGIGWIIGAGVGYGVYSHLNGKKNPSEQGQEEVTPPAPVPLPRKELSKEVQNSLMYRLFVGKSARENMDGSSGAPLKKLAREVETEKLHKEEQIDGPDDVCEEYAITPAGKFTMSQLLASGFVPSRNKIYIARTPDGTPITCPVSQFVHIALAGATRHGKTSIIRQLLSQLIYTNCDCVLIDPHFTSYDIETGEDWTPFMPYLKVPPQNFCQYSEIEKWLEHAATRMLDTRRKRRANQQPLGKDVFIFIDEYPAITAEIPAVQGHVSKLLREGGKYKIHLVIASQDFQVKTLFKDVGGSIRDCLGTVLYVGGDKVSVDALLNKPSFYDDSVENSLGKGRVIVKCAPSIEQKVLCQAQTPYTDNKSIYRLVGPSTYNPNAAERDTDELDVDELDMSPVTENFDKPLRVTAVPQTPPISTKIVESEAVTVTRDHRNVESEEAQEEAVSHQKEAITVVTALPTGWTAEKVQLLAGFYRVFKSIDKCLEALELSTSQRNRDFAREALQEKGLRQ